MAAREPTVESRHIEAACAVLKQQFVNWTADIPLVAQAIANAEAAAAAKAVEPWETLADYIGSNPDSGVIGCDKHNNGACVVEVLAATDLASKRQPTWTEAARDLCTKLGLLPPRGDDR